MSQRQDFDNHIQKCLFSMPFPTLWSAFLTVCLYDICFKQLWNVLQIWKYTILYHIFQSRITYGSVVPIEFNKMIIIIIMITIIINYEWLIGKVSILRLMTMWSHILESNHINVITICLYEYIGSIRKQSKMHRFKYCQI